MSTDVVQAVVATDGVEFSDEFLEALVDAGVLDDQDEDEL